MRPKADVKGAEDSAIVRDLRHLGELTGWAAARAPRSGIVDADGAMTAWTDVAEQVDSLALVLLEHRVAAGDRVAILHPKNSRSFIAVHAALRIGAIAVPLDPRGAPDSIETIIDAIEPAALISDAALLRRRMPANAHRIGRMLVGGDLSSLGHNERCLSLDDVLASGRSFTVPSIDTSSPAYIIFTSGSTGVPKGIVHTHDSALAYARHAVDIHRLDTTSRLAATAPLHFDMSTLELYAIPLAGASVLSVSDQQLMFPVSLASHIETYGATHLYAVPFQLRQLVLRGALAERDLTALVSISFGGEQFSEGALTELARCAPHAELLNVYGPAEVNGVVSHSFGTWSTSFETIPIGKPWPQVSIQIVDTNGYEVEPREAGELLVSSPSAMSHYWGLAERSAASFTDDGYYRTGDRVYRNERGELVFLGRHDNRVKVRGVRIELEEIERVICDIAGVVDVVAGVDRRGESEHVHVWLISDNREVDLQSLAATSRARLPLAAVPASAEVLAQPPLTQSGKLDRAALRRRLESDQSTS